MQVIIHILVPPDEFEETRSKAQVFLEGVKKSSSSTFGAEADVHISIQSQDTILSPVETSVTPEA